MPRFVKRCSAILGVFVTLIGCGGGGGEGGMANGGSGKAWEGAKVLPQISDVSFPRALVPIENGEALALMDAGKQGILAYRIGAAGPGQPTLVATENRSGDFDAVGDGAGNVLVTWAENIDSNHRRLRFKQYRAGSGWSSDAEDVHPSPPPDSSLYFGNASVDAVGGDAFVWTMQETKTTLDEAEGKIITMSTQSLYARRSKGGGAPSVVSKIDIDAPMGAVTARIHVHPSGVALLVWADGPYLRSYYSAGISDSWHFAMVLDDHLKGSVSLADIGLASVGDRILVLWCGREFNPVGKSINRETCSALFNTGSLNYEELRRTISSGDVAPRMMGVASSQVGRALAVWSQQGSDGVYRTCARIYDVTVGWDPEVTWIQESGNMGLLPRVAMNRSGDAVVAWQQGAANYFSEWALAGVYARIYQAGVWAPAERILEDGWVVGDPGLVDPTLSDSGEAIAVMAHSPAKDLNQIATYWNRYR